MANNYLKRNSQHLQFPQIINEKNFYTIHYAGIHRLAKRKVKPETLWSKLMELYKLLDK